MAIITAIIILALFILLLMAITFIPGHKRGVIFRRGRQIAVKGTGVFLIIPFVDRVVRVDLRTMKRDSPSQEVVTRDNWNVKASATIRFKVVDVVAAAVAVPDYTRKTSETLQIALRGLLKESARDELEHNLNQVSNTLQERIDKETKTWGVEVVEVDLKKMTFSEE